MIGGREVFVNPRTGVTDGGPYEFELPSQVCLSVTPVLDMSCFLFQGGMYLQLGSCKLYGRCKLVTENGEDIDHSRDEVGVVNLFPGKN